MPREISPEERERRRQQALDLVAQGKIGGPRPGSGRPRKRRASELIADRVAADAAEIWAKLKALSEDRSSTIRLQALREMLAIEERERGVRADEERELEKMRKDELLELVLSQFKALQDAGVIPETIDVEDAEEVEYEELMAGA